MLKPQKTQLSHQNTAVSSVFADERLELSVVVHDLQLDPGSGGTLADSVREIAHFSSPHKISPYKNSQLKSARQTRISVMDDPDELFNLNRRDQLGNKSSWILPSIYAACMVLRMTGPHTSLPNAHPEFASILAPGQSFYYMLIPVYVANAVFVVASFTPILRGTSIIQHGVSFFFPVIIICEYIWQWIFVKSSRVSDAMTLVVINCLFSLLLLINVAHRRRNDLNKVWHSKTHADQRLRDYWLVEVPCTIQACWSFLLVLITANYTIVADFLFAQGISHTLGTLAGRQMSGAVVTLLFLAVATAAGVLIKERGNGVVAFMATWAAFDWAKAVTRVPDVVQSPQLGWIEPMIDVPALREGCLLIASLSLTAMLASILFHSLNWTRIWKKRNQKDDFLFSSRNFPAFPTPSTTSGADYISRNSKNLRVDNVLIIDDVANGANLASMKRRPSEFLMRSDSSMTEGDTPVMKKVQNNNQ